MPEYTDEQMREQYDFPPDPGSTPRPEAANLWDEIPEGCEVRRCNKCWLVFLAGPGQRYHWGYCPENPHRRALEGEHTEPNLDPKPWTSAGIRHGFREGACGLGYCDFDPRPEFSQNPAHYPGGTE